MAELAGNLSLYQEPAFIEKIDQLLETGMLRRGGKYKQVAVRVIELPRSSLPRATAASKLNRNPVFIQNLMTRRAAGRGVPRRARLRTGLGGMPSKSRPQVRILLGARFRPMVS